MSRAIVAASAVPKKAAATIDPIPTYEICITLFPSIEVNRRSPKRGDDLGIFQGIGRAERRSINAPVGSINRLSRRRTADGVRQAATWPKPLRFADRVCFSEAEKDSKPNSVRLERGVTIRHRVRKIAAARKA
jgi:hypothetical protein